MPKVLIFNETNKENERIIEEEYQSYKEAINTFFKKFKLQNKLPKKTKIFLREPTKVKKTKLH
ncbi:MAG: hypothetical protein ACQBVK_05395 [Candidatus Phytoplasma sp. TWB_XP]